MAAGQGPGKGKSNNPKGKPKGAVNRTTKEAKELLEKILFGQLEDINSALSQIRKSDPAKYIDACSKLFTYVLPKQSDVKIDMDATVNIPLVTWRKKE